MADLDTILEKVNEVSEKVAVVINEVENLKVRLYGKEGDSGHIPAIVKHLEKINGSIESQGIEVKGHDNDVKLLKRWVIVLALGIPVSGGVGSIASRLLGVWQ